MKHVMIDGDPFLVTIPTIDLVVMLWQVLHENGPRELFTDQDNCFLTVRKQTSRQSDVVRFSKVKEKFELRTLANLQQLKDKTVVMYRNAMDRSKPDPLGKDIVFPLRLMLTPLRKDGSEDSKALAGSADGTLMSGGSFWGRKHGESSMHLWADQTWPMRTPLEYAIGDTDGQAEPLEWFCCKGKLISAACPLSLSLHDLADSGLISF